MMLTFIKCSFVSVDRANGEYVIFEKIENYPERIKRKTNNSPQIQEDESMMEARDSEIMPSKC